MQLFATLKSWAKKAQRCLVKALRTVTTSVNLVRETGLEIFNLAITEVQPLINEVTREVSSWFSSWSKDDYLIFFGFVLLFNPHLLCYLLILSSSAVVVTLTLLACLIKGLAVAAALQLVAEILQPKETKTNESIL